MELDALKVTFTHSNTVREKRPFTIYEIEVRSSTHTWVIYKRYRDFHTLHQELSKKNGVALSQENHYDLPHLPPKRLTRSLAVEFVEKRKKELQGYLRDILATRELLHSEVILDFLEVPDSIKPMLAHNQTGEKTHYPGGMDLKDMGEEARSHLLSSKIDYTHRPYEERRVLDLLTHLKHNQNRVAAIKSFEEYFFQTRPRLSSEYIKKLFYFHDSARFEGGLIETCGDFEYSHVASRAALYLLCRLLDVEKNKDATIYLEQFTSLPKAVLARMHLHLHILSERGNRLGAFKIVQVLQEKHNDPKFLDEVVPDIWARKKYHLWAERKAGTATAYGMEPDDFVLKSVSLADRPYRGVVKEMFHDIYKLKSEVDWHLVPFYQGALSSEEDEKEVPHPDDPKLCTNPDCVCKVQIKYKKDAKKDMVIVCASMMMPFEVDEVADIIFDLKLREYWDTKFHSGKVVEIKDRNTDVVQMVFKSFSSPYKYRDLCLLRSTTKLENGGRLLATRSVLHPSAPETEHVRAVLFPTGWIVTPTREPGRCFLSYIGQMDREAVLIISPDLLGESNDLRQGFQNLKTVLGRKKEGTLSTNNDDKNDDEKGLAPLSLLVTEPAN